MSEFNEINWKDALSKVYERSISDAEYRTLCLSDPRAAIAAVSEIEIPPDIKLQFFGQREDYLYAFLLPPSESDGGADPAELIRWNTYCTDMTITHGIS